MKYRLNTGIEVESIFPGIIPQLYEIEACVAAGYRYYHEWQQLASEQKAVLIGHYYASKMIEGHREEAVTDKIKRDSKRRGAK